MKNNTLKYIMGILLLSLTFSGCEMLESAFPSNKVMGVWKGYNSDDKATLNAELNLTVGLAFTVKFTDAEGDSQEIKGSYTYNPAQTTFLNIGKKQKGVLIFTFDDGARACHYYVDAQTLMIYHWKLPGEDVQRNLTLFR